MNDEQFWMVWNPNGRVPVVQHAEKRSAINEAERLARAYEGEAFYVLHATDLRCVNSMQRVALREPDMEF